MLGASFEITDVYPVGKNNYIVEGPLVIPHLKKFGVKSKFFLKYHFQVLVDGRLHLHFIESPDLQGQTSKQNKIIDEKTTENIKAFYRQKYGKELIYDGRA